MRREQAWDVALLDRAGGGWYVKAMSDPGVTRGDLDAISWLEPWMGVDADAAGALVRQLERELLPGHVLHGRPAWAVGRRGDRDDVLFQLENPAQLAVVHLGGSRSKSPEMPFAMLFESVVEFREACMLPDHAEWSDA